jgi:hypothetical protein
LPTTQALLTRTISMDVRLISCHSHNIARRSALLTGDRSRRLQDIAVVPAPDPGNRDRRWIPRRQVFVVGRGERATLATAKHRPSRRGRVSPSTSYTRPVFLDDRGRTSLPQQRGNDRTARTIGGGKPTSTRSRTTRRFNEPGRAAAGKRSNHGSSVPQWQNTQLQEYRPTGTGTGPCPRAACGCRERSELHAISLQSRLAAGSRGDQAPRKDAAAAG